MVEGLPGPNFAGVKQYPLNIKADMKVRGRLRYRVVPGPLYVYCALFYCPGRIVCGVLAGVYCPGRVFCVLKMCCGDIVGIFLANSAEKCDLTRGVVLFSDRMWCNCVPMHVIYGF